MMSKLFTVLFILALAETKVHAQTFGLIYSEITGNPDNFSQHCFTYNPKFHQLPESVEEAPKYRLANLLPSVVCDESDVTGKDFSNAVVAVKRGDCTFSEKATLIQDHHGKAILVVSEDGNVTPSPNSSADYNRINITVALIQEDAFKEITDLGPAVSVQLYAPAPRRVDYNLVVVWLIAVLTVAAGSYWSGTVKHRRALRRLKKKKKPSDRKTPDDEDDDDALDSLEPSPLHILVFVVLMCGMLVSLYYLFNYLVYLIIFMFALASATSMYACLKPIMLRCCGSKASCRFPSVRVPCCRGEINPEVRRVLLALLSVSVAVAWVVLRHEWYAWILQDVLGIMFCMNMMKTLRLSSLQGCAFLLILLFVYDVFFVFITPLFTEDGESIMVKVATGGGGGGGPGSEEKLPMVFLVPRFHSSLCGALPYSMLGFGDIMVPGLLVSYCYGFDLQVDSGKVYYIVTSIGYGVGMLCTFVALAYMEVGQPALLYLVPCTLIPTVLVALKRRELRKMWHGKAGEQKKKYESGTDESADTDSRQVTPTNPGINHRNSSSGSLNAVVAEGDSISNASSTDSQQRLINN